MSELIIGDVGILIWEATPERQTTLGYVSDITAMSLETPNKNYDLLGLLSSGWKVGIGYSHNSASAHDRDIRLKTPEGIEWLANAMHEFGHVDEFQKNDFSLQEHDWVYLGYQLSDHFIKPETLFGVLRYECNAWEWALVILRGMDLPVAQMRRISDHIKSDRILGSYVRNITTGFLLEQAAKNEEIETEKLRNDLHQIYHTWLQRNKLL